MQVSRRGLLGAGGALLLGSGAKAQPASGWPNRPIRMVVPFAPGGAGDTAARAITPRWGEKLGQIFVVENRPGAGGSVGGAAVAAATPDGYTLMLDASSHLVNPALMRGLPFDYVTGFTSVSRVASFPGMLAVKQGFPARTVAEFVAVAKKRPGAVSVGTQGNATAGHLGS